jgi:Flp pilus assembly protein TadG
MKQREHKEEGFTTLFVVLIALALLAMAGLVIDGGYAMASNRRLAGQAEQAARIGADALDQDSLRDGGVPEVDRAKAIAAAQNYLSQVGAPRGQVSIDGGTVSVTLKSHSETAILSAVGVTELPTGGHASAESIDEDGPR